MPELSDARLAPLFPIPFMRYRWVDSQSLNAALRASILEREGASGGQRKSNVGGWQSTEDFETWTGVAGQTLVGRIFEMAGHATRLLLADHKIRDEFRWKLALWANVNRRGQYNKLHLHPGSTWSGTYYVDAGEPAAEGDDLAGALALVNPNEAASMTFFAKLPHALNIHPRDGLMVLFPSYVPHMVYPHTGNQPRISVAFNLKKDPYP